MPPPRGRARARSALERNSWGISEAFQSSFEAGNSDSAVRRGVRRCRIAVCAGLGAQQRCHWHWKLRGDRDARGTGGALKTLNRSKALRTHGASRMQATHAFLSCSIAFDAFVEMHVKNDENIVPDQDTTGSNYVSVARQCLMLDSLASTS